MIFRDIRGTGLGDKLGFIGVIAHISVRDVVVSGHKAGSALERPEGGREAALFSKIRDTQYFAKPQDLGKQQKSSNVCIRDYIFT